MAGSNAAEGVTTAAADAGGGVAAGLDTSAAMVRTESEYLDGTLRALAQRLSSVPGLELSVSPRPGILRRLIGDLPYVGELGPRTPPVHRIVVKLGASSYWLHASDGSLICGREGRSSERGQFHEELTFKAWATTLFDEIARRNLANHDAMLALRRLVEEDQVE
jgi:hypothetical protein